jgi:DNA polymerase-4
MEEFSVNLPNVIHLDINSCFATIEQQANPTLRDKPVVVCAYTTNNGCILAASITAKKLGIKTGMRVGEAKLIYPNLIILLPDPPKYRFVHRKIKKILKDYSDRVVPKSIDEFVFSLPQETEPTKVALEVKQRIKKEIGEYITVSIGISTNTYLAKVASNLEKPDGLVEINKENILDIFKRLKLTDLTGIKRGNSIRLRKYGIKTTLDFYNSPIWKLRLAFGGIGGFYWYQRLHGYEIDVFKSKRGMIGNSYAPPPNKADEVLSIISKLAEKTGFRLRSANLKAMGVHLFLQDRNGNFWHMERKLNREIFETKDINFEIKNLLKISPIQTNFRNIAISTFNFKKLDNLQLEIFDDIMKRTNLVKAIDTINKKWGLYTIHMGSMSTHSKVVQDRISFGQL